MKPPAFSQIEAAAGLAAGSGALYRHFKSKDALLDAGIDRQLDRRSAMRDIRALFAGLGDLHAELTVLGRYLLSVIDEEIQLLQIAARTPAGHSARLDTAYAALIDGLNANWRTSPPGRPKVSEQDCGVLSHTASTPSSVHFATGLFNQPKTRIPDDRYLTEWTALLTTRIETVRNKPRSSRTCATASAPDDGERRPVEPLLHETVIEDRT